MQRKNDVMQRSHSKTLFMKCEKQLFAVLYACIYDSIKHIIIFLRRKSIILFYAFKISWQETCKKINKLTLQFSTGNVCKI